MVHHIVNALHMPDSTRCLRQLCLLLLGYALVACSSLDSASKTVVGAVSPYKIDIVQGNFVSAEQLAAVKPGMNRAQVRDILGTPLLASVFHADRWDYVFTFRRQGQAAQSRTLSVFSRLRCWCESRLTPCPPRPSLWRRWTQGAGLARCRCSSRHLRQPSQARRPSHPRPRPRRRCPAPIHG